MAKSQNKDKRKAELQSFLESKDSSIEQVIENVRSFISVHPTDVLIAVGSLVEGLGTSKSDLDLVLITDRDIATIPESEHLGWVEGTSLVDMLVFHRSKADQLIFRFWSWYGKKWDLSRSADFTMKERTILHRLYTGVPLLNPDNLEALRTPDERGLALLKFHVARQSARTMLVDLVGLEEFHDYRSLVFTAQVVLGLAVEALLAGFGLLNPLVKWRSRQLEAVPEDWLTHLNSPYTNIDAATLVWQLSRLPETLEPEEALAYAHRIAVFSRSVSFWVESKLLELKPVPKNFIIDHREPSADDGRVAPLLRLDADIFVSTNGMAISRLNEFDSPVVLDEEEVRLALLFDGHTSLELILAKVFGDARSRLGSRVLDRLLEKLDEQSLITHTSCETGVTS